MGKNSNHNTLLGDGKDATRTEYFLIKAEKEEQKKKMRRLAFFRSKTFAREEAFECQLYRSEEKFPRTQVMTTFEKSKKNKDFVQQYLRRTKNGEKSVLWRWEWCDRAAYVKARRSKVYGIN